MRRKAFDAAGVERKRSPVCAKYTHKGFAGWAVGSDPCSWFSVPTSRSKGWWVPVCKIGRAAVVSGDGWSDDSNGTT